MGSAAQDKKKPAAVSKPSDVKPKANAPERVRKPHYDWEHESQADCEAPRAKAGGRIAIWKVNVQTWIKRYLTLADSGFGHCDDDPTPA